MNVQKGAKDNMMTFEIKTEEQYTEALSEIEKLFDIKPGDSNWERFNLLVEAVEKYEDIHYPID